MPDVVPNLAGDGARSSHRDPETTVDRGGAHTGRDPGANWLSGDDDPTGGWLRTMLYAAVFGCAVLLGQLTRIPETELPMVCPAAGIAVLWLLGSVHRPRRMVVDALAVLATVAVLTVLTDTSWGPSLVYGVANAVQAGLLAWLIGRRAYPRLRQPRQLGLLVISALLACAAGVLVFTPGLLWANSQDDLALVPADVGLTVAAMFIRNVGACVLIVAAGLRLFDPEAGLDVLRDMRRTETAWVLAGMSVTFFLVFGLYDQVPTAYLMFPVLVWMGATVSTTGTAVLLCLITALLTGLTGRHTGPTAGLSGAGQTIDTQAWSTAAAVVALGVALLRDDRHRATARASRLAERVAASESERCRTRAAIRRLADEIPLGVLILGRDDSAKVVAANAYLRDRLATNSQDLAGSPLWPLVHPEDTAALRALLSAARRGEQTPPVQVRWHTRTPGMLVGVCRVPPATADDEREYLVLTIEDVTGVRELERVLHDSRTHDTLTRAVNDRACIEHLDRALQATGETGMPVGVVSIDLDGFRSVNARFGETAADSILTTVCDRLVALLRPGDVVARIRGDEFAVICPRTTRRGLQVVVTQVAEEISRPIHLEHGTVRVRASLGSVTSAEPAVSPRQVLRSAQQQMYAAKRAACAEDATTQNVPGGPSAPGSITLPGPSVLPERGAGGSRGG
ncbi:MAG: hypothetical protein CSA58_07665 [Micrococcales bacterium]|nr:MAG: hypothetical protein CSB46_04070 [Micrococcales bacterium]PIE26759.1 MAG: hypothetical protein CSA58_07665 [Micrococcales bacterium]